MKKVLLSIMLLFSVLTFGQARVNETLPQFIETSNSFYKTTEYEYREYDGKWHEQNNDSAYFFKTLEFKTIEFESKKYYILVINELDGAYKYPSIKKDFITWKSIRGYIFTSEEYNKLKTFNEGVSKYSEIKVDDISGDGVENLRLDIINTLKNNYSGNHKFKIKTENENTIRFILPIKSKYSVLESYYGFDKKYFESNKIEFSKLFNLK